MMKNRLILASRSSRRYELLKQLGIEIDVVPSRVEEDFILGETPRDRVIRLSDAKASEVGERFPGYWVIGADTIVLINKSILGKPKDREEAIEMLRLLSGKEHRVITGISVQHRGKGRGDCEVVETTVRVKRLSAVEMDWYIQTGEPFDKAGGYGIQGIGSFMIESIHGSYTNVVGLPLCELIQMLIRLGALTISKEGMQVLE